MGLFVPSQSGYVFINFAVVYFLSHEARNKRSATIDGMKYHSFFFLKTFVFVLFVSSSTICFKLKLDQAIY